MILPVASATATAAATSREPAVDPVTRGVTPSSPSERGAGGPAEDLRKATLGFERVLLTQLLAPLTEAAGEDAPAAYKELLPQTLADAVVDGGGIGLAADLQRALMEQSR